MVSFNPSKLAIAVVKAFMSVTNGHAGGPGYKGKAATATIDCAMESTGTDGAAIAVAGDDDDDGDGDGDPDSDRAPHISLKPSHTKTLQTALHPKRITTANRILRMAELKTRIGLSRSTIYEFQNSGNFPRSISLGSRAVGWLESDVDAWLESRINASKAA
ncbi:MAG: AlpA family phage regulatory protein [Pseudomonadota bacterium]